MRAHPTSSITSLCRLVCCGLALGLVLISAGPGAAADTPATTTQKSGTATTKEAQPGISTLETKGDNDDKFEVRGTIRLGDSVRIPLKRPNEWTEKL